MLRQFHTRYKYSLILLRELVRADFKIKYQDSFLGYIWSVLKPLFMFAILYVVFIKVLRIGANIPHWPIAMLTGILLWQFFLDITTGSLKSIVSSGNLLRKIKFPRYIIIMARSVSAFITLAINSTVVVLFAMFNGVELTWHIIAIIPLVIQLFVFALGTAFFLSAVYVKFRDIQYIWELVSQAMFYGSAILFPISLIANLKGEIGFLLAHVALANPVAQIIQDIRYTAINNNIPSLWTLSNGNIWAYCAPILITVIVFIFGVWFFRRRSPYFAEDV